MQIFTGIDVGNHDVKSPNTSTPSGYTSHNSLPAMTDEYLYWNGRYYIPSQKRFDYKEDKTNTERCLVLTLFGIAKELMHKAQRKKADLQSGINKYDTIALGAGLPPQHWQHAAKTKAYYEDYLSKGIEFEYSGIRFAFRMNYCKLFPQAWAAIVTNGNNEIIGNYNKFYAIDIGGGTMDILPFLDGLPDTAHVITESAGTMFMYKEIINNVRNDFALDLDNKDVENILFNKPTILRSEIKNYVLEKTQQWTDVRIVDFLSNNGIKFATTPTIWLGGGSLLLKKYISRNTLVINETYLTNPKLNARGYALLVEQSMRADTAA